jgi:putative oxidoreductase
MSVRDALARALTATAAVSFLAPLLTRLTLGHAFFLTGRGKLEHFDNFVGFLASLGIPAPELNAHVVARLEYYGGIALVLGLATRLFAAALAGTMVMAILTSERETFFASWLPTGEIGPTDIAPFVFFLLLTWLVLFGPGLLSLDAVVARRLGLSQSEPAPAAPKLRETA